MGSGSDNGLGNGLGNGLDSGTEMEEDNPFQEETQVNTLNRNELMQLPTKELAKLAQPYSNKKLQTLEKTAKSTLCDLILNKSDHSQEENKTHSRTGTAKSETETFIDGALGLLDVLKSNRDNEPLHAAAKEIFKKQAIVYADNKVANDEMNVNKANTALFVLATGAVLIDGIIGFKNLPGFFMKMKKKFSSKSKKDDSK